VLCCTTQSPLLCRHVLRVTSVPAHAPRLDWAMELEDVELVRHAALSSNMLGGPFGALRQHTTVTVHFVTRALLLRFVCMNLQPTVY